MTQQNFSLITLTGTRFFAYAILGGIPHYLRQWNPHLSVDENIKRNILTKGCILYSEVDFLASSGTSGNTDL